MQASLTARTMQLTVSSEPQQRERLARNLSLNPHKCSGRAGNWYSNSFCPGFRRDALRADARAFESPLPSVVFIGGAPGMRGAIRLVRIRQTGRQYTNTQ